LDVTIAEAVPRPGPELDEGDLADYGYTGDGITQESPGIIPQLQEKRGQGLRFIQQLLVRFLLGEYISKCQNTSGD
jgi:hypothetical protein